MRFQDLTRRRSSTCSARCNAPFSRTCGRLRPSLGTYYGRAAPSRIGYTASSKVYICFPFPPAFVGVRALRGCDSRSRRSRCPRPLLRCIVSRLAPSDPLRMLCCSFTASLWRMLVFAFSRVRSASSYSCSDIAVSRIPTTSLSRIISFSRGP